MTKEEKAREIVRQDGKCSGFPCDVDDENECPCYAVCRQVNGGNIAHPSKVLSCRDFLSGISEPQPTKTMLDEFAMAAIGPLLSIAFSVGTSFLTARSECAKDSYMVASAMMAERARRDEMGNVKEVK